MAHVFSHLPRVTLLVKHLKLMLVVVLGGWSQFFLIEQNAPKKDKFTTYGLPRKKSFAI